MRNIPFSPPDMSEAEASMVAEVLGSGWITTGPKTKEFEHLIAMCSGGVSEFRYGVHGDGAAGAGHRTGG